MINLWYPHAMHKRTFVFMGIILSMVLGGAAHADEARSDPRVAACEWTQQEVNAINHRVGQNYRTILIYRSRLEQGELNDARERQTLREVVSSFHRDLDRWRPRLADVDSSLSWECSDYPKRTETAQLSARLRSGMRLLESEIAAVIGLMRISPSL